MLALPFVLLLALLPGQQDSAPPAARPGPRGSTGQSAVRLAALQALADTFESALEEDDYPAFASCFAIQALLDAATDVPEVRASLCRGFQERMRSELLPGLFRTLGRRMEEGWQLSILHVRLLGQDQSMLLRLIGTEGGVNYIEFLASTRGTGRPLFVDWNMYSLGERISQTLRRAFLPLALQSQRGLFERLLGQDQHMVKYSKEFKQLSECALAGRWEEGLRVFGALPAEVQHEKLVLLLRLGLAQSSGSEERQLAALADLQHFLPDDPANDLFAIDYYTLRKQWKRAAEAVRRLRAAVDGDPFLDAREALALLQGGEIAAAREAVERALAGEPLLLWSHWIYLRVCRDQQDHDALLAGMKHMDSVFCIEWDDLRQSEGYESFVASPQHAEWLRYLAAKR